MLGHWGKLDVVREGPWQQWPSVGILKLHGELQSVRMPGDRNSETKADCQTRMPGGEASDPKRVPAATEDEEFPANRLHGVGQKCDIDTRT